MLTVTEAAVQLGVSTRRVRELIAKKKLKATKKSNGWAITENALAKVQRMERKPGRPRK